MAFKIDYHDDAVYEWRLTPDGVDFDRNEEYTPTIYVAAERTELLVEIRPYLERHGRVAATALEEHRTGWRTGPETVLRIDLSSIDAVRQVASTIREWGAEPGTYRCFNVDFSREFRYCLENGIDPRPTRAPSMIDLRIPKPQLGADRLTSITIDDEPIDGSPVAVLETVRNRLESRDPDVLLVNHSEVVPTLFTAADTYTVDIRLGRRPGYQRLAGRSTYESYGNVGHSPARYNVPGRAIVDRSNTFFWNQTNLDGLLDLVHRSRKPLQEAAWASIGNVLTAIQIRHARERDVLVPWHSWRHEFFKSMETLHEADRGGVVFAPAVGVHEDVHELDFASLYPNIIATRNVSPETVCCDCHAERSDVPDLGYSICDERGYLVDVLRPLIADRAAYKSELEATDDPERREILEGRSAALKWILVSCFGYQGFSNAKFGRIECHEAINAFAREVLLEAKEALEGHGWAVVHGIVDSLWVTPDETTDQTPLAELCRSLSDSIGIPLEYERRYDWIAFAPRRDGDTGALNRYFGKVSDEDSFKIRGLECRQRNTPAYVESCQRELIEAFSRHRDPEAVCDLLGRQLRRLRTDRVDPEALVITTRVSQPRSEYAGYTRTVSALERAEACDVSIHPGESVEYVVTDDESRSRDRVTLRSETPLTYDSEYYSDRLLTAAESVLSPVGWRRQDIRRYLADTRETSLRAFS